MAKMKVAQVSKAKGDFEIVEREIPSPGPGQVRIKVQACGVCHSDLYTKEGLWPGLQFPRVPGHEVAGVIDEVGSGVTTWKKGDRAGVGWHGGQDNTCPACRAGDFANCESNKITGITYDGGYEQYMVAPIEAVAHIPDELEPAEAAPLLCAGITTFNALRHSGAGPGDLVAVQGIGGLGHLGFSPPLPVPSPCLKYFTDSAATVHCWWSARIWRPWKFPVPPLSTAASVCRAGLPELPAIPRTRCDSQRLPACAR